MRKNKNYVYSGDKAIVIDEKGDYRQVEYKDNLGEILSQENLVEELEDEISKLEEKEREYDEYCKVYKTTHPVKKNILAHFLILIGSGVIDGILIFTYLISGTAMTLSDIITCFIVPTVLAYAVYWLNKFYQNYLNRNFTNKKNGIKLQLEYLNKELEKQKTKLNELKNQKSEIKNKEEFNVVKVKELEEHQTIFTNLKFYNDFGYNKYKIYKSYMNGGLKEEVNKLGYTQEQIEFIEEYIRNQNINEQSIEEKGSVKSKRKRKTRKYGE